MEYRSLCYGDVINRSHPLNRGLVAEWAVIPWYASGLRLIDLCGQAGTKNSGTLNGATWTGTSFYGGSKALNFDGASRVDTVVYSPLGPYTLEIWCNPATTGTVQHLICNDNTAVGTNDRAWQFRLDADGTVRLIAFSSGNSNVQANGGTSVTGNGWVHIAGTYDNVTAATYVNGQFVASTSGGATLTNVPDAAVTLCSGVPGGFGGLTPMTGAMWSASIRYRAMSADDIASLYYETRLGNPNRWQWYRSRTYLGITPPPAGDLVGHVIAGGRLLW